MSLLTFREDHLWPYPLDLIKKSSARVLLSAISTLNIENIASTILDFVADTNIYIWEFEKY